jgi:hypothetical protein
MELPRESKKEQREAKRREREKLKVYRGARIGKQCSAVALAPACIQTPEL